MILISCSVSFILFLYAHNRTTQRYISVLKTPLENPLLIHVSDFDLLKLNKEKSLSSTCLKNISFNKLLEKHTNLQVRIRVLSARELSSVTEWFIFLLTSQTSSSTRCAALKRNDFISVISWSRIRQNREPELLRTLQLCWCYIRFFGSFCRRTQIVSKRNYLLYLKWIVHKHIFKG